LIAPPGNWAVLRQLIVMPMVVPAVIESTSGTRLTKRFGPKVSMLCVPACENQMSLLSLVMPRNAWDEFATPYSLMLPELGSSSPIWSKQFPSEVANGYRAMPCPPTLDARAVIGTLPVACRACAFRTALAGIVANGFARGGRGRTPRETTGKPATSSPRAILRPVMEARH